MEESDPGADMNTSWVSESRHAGAKKIASSQIPLLVDRPVIEWLPGETVFSLASRYHRLSGNARHEITAQQLFGCSRGGFPHDLPGGISVLESVFQGSLGTCEEIIATRTILPAIIAFRSAEIRQDAVTALASGAIGSLKARLGLLATRFGALLDLKACPHCMDDDKEKEGVSYWHLEHQLPGVWICRRHFCLLKVSASKRAGQNRFGWTLPRIDDLVDPMAACWQASEIDGASTTLMVMANAANSIYEISRFEPIQPQHIATIFRARLSELGLIYPSGRINQKEIGNSFLMAMNSVRGISELASLAASPSAAYSQVLRLLKADDLGMHPLRVISAVAWLFDDWNDFISSYKNSYSEIKPTESDGSAGVASKSPRLYLKKRVVNLVIKNGISVSSAAKSAGVDVSTAQAWLAAEGIESSRRPSIIKPKLRQALISNLTKGMDKEIAREKAGISIVSVNRILRTEVGLHQAWVDARFEIARKKARSEWTKAMEQAAGLGVKAVRSLAKGSYAWLYRNDRAWLYETNEAIAPSARSNHASVDWDKRDTELSQKVRAAAIKLRDENLARKISIVEIIKEVPQLKSKLKRIENLPLTDKAIKIATRTPKSHLVQIEL